MAVDLHIHSHYSDGTLSPSEILKRAKRKGLKVVSVTDHDTVAGVTPTLTAAREEGLTAIPGIEFSVYHNDTQLHLLGYFVDHEDISFLEKIRVLQQARRNRNTEIIKKLQLLGYDISEQDVADISSHGQTGRPHIASRLCAIGAVKSIDEAFARFLGHGKKAYVSRFLYTAEEAINFIRRAGGVSVLAHPLIPAKSWEEVRKLVAELVVQGLDGLELYYPTHTAKIVKKLRKIIEQHSLVFSGGSDYHGDIRQGTDLAGGYRNFVPEETYQSLHKLWLSRQK